MAEMWDLYTKHRVKTGKLHERCAGEYLPKDCYHLTVHVWLRNRQGQFLLSKRSASRPTYPLLWECPGGSVLAGECSLAGAVRETKEEVGVTLTPEDGKLLLTKVRDEIDGKYYRDILDVWLFDYDGPVCLEQATTDEVEQCHWMTMEEIRQLYEGGSMVHSLRYFFSLFTDTRTVDTAVIGRHVSGVIDRPMGSTHPRHPDLYYPVNYGYVSGVMAADGAEQDVYVLDEACALERFAGVVIGVYHRFDDIEDKWIVTGDGHPIDKDWILGEIAFQEKFFTGKLYLDAE